MRHISPIHAFAFRPNRVSCSSSLSRQLLIHKPPIKPSTLDLNSTIVLMPNTRRSTTMSSAGDQPLVVTFYSRSKSRDPSVPSLDEILAFSNTQLEHKHDFIQVLFPLPERSPINPGAPVLTPQIRSAFTSNPDLRANLFDAFKRMASFYGFSVEGSLARPSDIALSPLPQFEALSRQTWRTRFDHNHLRITRIIRCLRILGLEDVARAFFVALRDNTNGEVSGRTLMYWQRAAERGLWLPPDEDNDGAEGVQWLK